MVGWCVCVEGKVVCSAGRGNWELELGIAMRAQFSWYGNSINSIKLFVCPPPSSQYQQYQEVRLRLQCVQLSHRWIAG